jgi:hypothetical protein
MTTNAEKLFRWLRWYLIPLHFRRDGSSQKDPRIIIIGWGDPVYDGSCAIVVTLLPVRRLRHLFVNVTLGRFRWADFVRVLPGRPHGA